MTPVDVSLCAQAYTSAPGTARAAGRVPGSPLVTTESARNGALFVTVANLLVNSPYARCAARSRTRLNAAASQNAVVPPLPSTTSYPSGREKNEVRPSRTRCTRSLTGFCRCEVPSTVVAMDARYSTCSGRTLLGPEPKRPSEGLSSFGIVIAGVCVAVVTRPVSRTGLRERRHRPDGRTPLPVSRRAPGGRSTGPTPRRPRGCVGPRRRSAPTVASAGRCACARGCAPTSPRCGRR